jgi:hypothetical protein
VSRAGIFLIAVALIAGMVSCGPILPPSQDSQDLEIRDWYDLDDIRDNLSGDHILMNDLNSTTPGYTELASPTANQGKGWDPIGTCAYPYGFWGTFDGQGYEIRDLFINRPDEMDVGLFGGVMQDGVIGVIKDIGVVNFTVTGDDHVGGLAAYNNGIVSNCYATGNVTGGGYRVGGLVGMNAEAESTVSNSYFTGSVTGSDHDVGGLVGRNWGDVSNSYYNYDEALINGENIITIGALFGEDFDQWLANDKFLDINERLSQENGYYVVNSVSDFKELLAFGQNASLKFRLKNDLDLGDEPNFNIPYLAGEFDGNDHKISNLSFNSDFVYTVGLFGYLAPGGKVTNLGVENVDITGYQYVGGLVGINYEATVSNSYSTGSVIGTYNRVGGLVGYNHGTVSDSYSTVNVTGNSYVGGLVGANWEGTVSNSYSTGSVTGSDQEVGGLVGNNRYSTVSNSYSIGNVTGGSFVGGLVGHHSYGTVSNSYSTGSVTGNELVSGLVGYSYKGTVSNSYSTGSVTGNDRVGGLVGNNRYGTVSDSFWDTETSGQATSDGGTGKTTTEMQDIATFSGAGWNICEVALGETYDTYTWNIVDGETYPFLSWQP